MRLIFYTSGHSLEALPAPETLTSPSHKTQHSLSPTSTMPFTAKTEKL